MTRLVFTCGDINGIGPEICVKTFNKIFASQKRQIIYLCPKKVFLESIKLVKPKFKYTIISEKTIHGLSNSKVSVIDAGNSAQNYGVPSKISGRISFNAIHDAVNLVKSKVADAIITAPISKEAFGLSGIKYPGHTELLAELTSSKKYLMVFLSENLICALATIHNPISQISGLITKKKISDSLDVLYEMLKKDLGIKSPRIAVLGLNPHSGENGIIGKEEIEIIKPVINKMKGLNIYGPFTPDAFWGNKSYKNYDAVFGMYHDQVLIPFKMLNFSSGVNYTAGLPIVRTSPDHGTAYDIAGKGIANPDSMIQAALWAETIVKNRQNY